MEHSKNIIAIVVSLLIYSVALFFASKGLKTKEKSYTTALITAATHAGVFLILSLMPYAKFFSYLILIYFIKYYYKEKIGTAVKLWVFSLLNSLLIFVIFFIIVFMFGMIFHTSFDVFNTIK